MPLMRDCWITNWGALYIANRSRHEREEEQEGGGVLTDAEVQGGALELARFQKKQEKC
jgi:hypothetical protein